MPQILIHQMKQFACAVGVSSLVMGVMIANSPKTLAPIFDFAFSTAAPKVWGITFFCVGVTLLVSLALDKMVYTALYLTSFMFWSWGAVLLLSTLRGTVFTSGYPLVCLLAGYFCMIAANFINRRSHH